MNTGMTQYAHTETGLTMGGHKIKEIPPEDYDAMMMAARDMGFLGATPRSIYIADRDQMIMRIMYECGTRVSSTLLMNIDSVSRRDDTIVFEQQKKRVHTMHKVSITPELRDAIMEYMMRHALTINKNCGLLFGIKRKAFDLRLRKYAKEAGIPPVSAHAFRHGCAMNLLRAGVPINVISFRLGHSNVNVTASTYANMTSDIERAYLERARTVAWNSKTEQQNPGER